MVNINVKDKINEACIILNEVETFINKLDDELKRISSKQQDLLHLIEANKLKTNECYRVIKELHSVRLERRRIKNDIELANTLNLHKNQLLSIENRKFLINLLDTKEKQLLTSKYKNRVYTEEELKKLIGG